MGEAGWCGYFGINECKDSGDLSAPGSTTNQLCDVGQVISSL